MLLFLVLREISEHLQQGSERKLKLDLSEGLVIEDSYMKQSSCFING